jgi:hypothetical protein
MNKILSDFRRARREVINIKNKKIILPIVLLLVGLGAGFFAGIKYQQLRIRKNSFLGGFNGVREVNGNIQRARGGGNVFGEVIAVDEKSITVKMQDGSSKIVFLSDSTTINKASEGSKDDIKTGTNVMVIGATNTDGSVAATSIQLNPKTPASPVPAQ